MRRMDETGCDLFLDIHGDEEIAANFLAGSEVSKTFIFSISLHDTRNAVCMFGSEVLTCRSDLPEWPMEMPCILSAS